MRAEPIEVVLVDDHPLFSQGLELVLHAATDRVRITGRTADAAMAVDLVRRHRPHVALVDLAMPPPGGVNAVRAVVRAQPGVRVLALSGVTEREIALDALRAGAAGFLPKTAEPEELLHPLLAVVEGWSVLPPGLLLDLLAAARRPGAEAVDGLDEDDRGLWRLIARGADTSEIARRLLVSERTAKRLVASLLRAVGARNRVEAAALAGRSGLLDDE